MLRKNKMETEQRNNTQTQEEKQARLVLGRVEYVEDRTHSRENGNQFTFRPFFSSFYIFNLGLAENYGRGFSKLSE